MMDLGQLLRQTREAQELSLADVEEQTRIRRRYLAALEAGDWEDLPNEIVARGFLRTYAEFLGLDIEAALKQGKDAQEKPSPSEPETAAQADTAAPDDYQPINLDLYDVDERRTNILRQLLRWALILIPVFVLAYLLVQFGLPLLLDQTSSSERPAATVTLPPAGTPNATRIIIVGASTETTTPTATETPPPDIDTPEPDHTPQPDRTPQPTFTPTPEATATPTATPIQQIALRVQVTQMSWTRLVADDFIYIEQIIDPGFDQTFTAASYLQIRTGNAAGVTLTLNGEELPPLGEAGEIVEFTWIIDNGDVIEVTPTATPLPETPAAATVTPSPNP